MEEIEQIKTSYRQLRAKCMYFRNYLEHAVAISKRSSDLLFRALQIPRDTSWNDPLLNHCVEAGERQRALFDEMSVSYNKTLFKELDKLNALIISETRFIDEEMKLISEKPAASLKELKEARNRHINAWMSNRQDPWLTEFVLKRAIREVLLRDEEANRMMISKVDSFSTSLRSATDRFSEILSIFMRIQKQTHFDLGDSMNIEKKCSEVDSFFDAASESPKEHKGEEISDEKMKEKIEVSFDTFVEGISRELSDKNITVRKNLEVVKSCVCRTKRGYTGDWIMTYMLVTSTNYAHFIDISASLNKLKESKRVIDRFKSISKGFGAMFDTGKSKNEFGDEGITEINGNIMSEIETLIPSIFFSIRLSSNAYEIDRERSLVFIYDKQQNGLATLFGINGMKVKFPTLSSAWEMFSALKNERVVAESPEAKKDEVRAVEGNKEFRVVLQEDNPWIA